jgi:O-antigen/teichoic acid export membrane protein
MTETVQEHESILREIRTASRHMAIYGIGNVLVKALGFLMLPFYTHYLNPRDYGILEILDLSMSLFALVLNMGLVPAFLRCHAAAETPEKKLRLVSTSCTFGIATGLLTFFAGLSLVRPVTTLLFGPAVPATYVLISFSALILNYIATLPRTYLRAREESGTYVTADTLAVFALLLLNVYFIAVLKVGLAGVLLSSLIVAAIQCIGFSIWALRKTGIQFHAPDLKRMLRFGLPLVLANLGLFVLNFSDRFFLQHLRSLDAVGVYAVGYKFGFMMNYLFVQPFFVMWQSRMYAIHANPGHRRVFKEIFALYSLGLLFAGLAMALFCPEVIQVMVERRFSASQDVVPIVVLAYVFYGISYYAQLGMLLTDRTKAIGLIGAGAAVLNLALNYILIMHYGMMGAAWATLLSFAAIALASYWSSQRVFPLPLGVGRMMLGLLLALALYLPFRAGIGGQPLAVMALKAAALAAFPILAWKTRILPESVSATIIAGGSRLWFSSRRCASAYASDNQAKSL